MQSLVSPSRTRVIAATRRGSSHDRDGSSWQDRALVLHADPVQVVLVADGVGSARHGDLGADVAIHAAASLIEGALGGIDVSAVPSRAPEQQVVTRLRYDTHGVLAPDVEWRTLLRCAVVAACRAVRGLPGRYEGALSDYATTLAIVVVTPDTITAAQIGDGFIVQWDGEVGGPAAPLAYTETDPEHPGTVVALTSRGALSALRLESTPRLPNAPVLVSTDGIGPVLVDRWHPVELSMSFLGALARRIQAPDFDDHYLAWLLDSTSVRSRADDDLTVVLVADAPPDRVDVDATRELVIPARCCAPGREQPTAGSPRRLGRSAARSPSRALGEKLLAQARARAGGGRLRLRSPDGGGRHR